MIVKMHGYRLVIRKLKISVQLCTFQTVFCCASVGARENISKIFEVTCKDSQ
jgi:hypothetical protein